MFSTVVPSNPSRLEEEFTMKVKYNFKLHVLLCLKGVNWSRQNILKKIYSLKGYRCHKVVRYGTQWSHLHIKFSEEQQAKEAVEFFTNLNSDLTAVLVHDMLRDWHNFETRSAYNPPWTLTIVDIVGATPKSLNFLTENLLNYVLQDFGQPYLSPYTAAFSEAHVQVLFSSMTEALAACMAFGQWYERYRKSDQFCYRVRINPSHKEALLIQNSGGVPEEAFKLDYFVTAKYEVNRNTLQKDCVQQNNVVVNSKCDETWNRSEVKSDRFVQDKSLLKQNCYPQMKMYSPIIFVPIISPINVSSTQAFATVQMANSEFDSSLLRLQNDSNVVEQIQPLSEMSDREDQVHRGTHENCSRCSEFSYENMNHHAVCRIENEPQTNITWVKNSFQTVSVQKHCVSSSSKYKDVYKGNSLIFERTK